MRSKEVPEWPGRSCTRSNEGAQLVEVLSGEEYAEEHLPGAINLPLKDLDAQTSAQLDRGTPVVVYCRDSL